MLLSLPPNFNSQTLVARLTSPAPDRETPVPTLPVPDATVPGDEHPVSATRPLREWVLAYGASGVWTEVWSVDVDRRGVRKLPCMLAAMKKE